MDKFFVKHDINCYITGFKTDFSKKQNKNQKQPKNVCIDTFVTVHFSQHFKCKIKFKFKI